jgi:hypothetical protein
MPRAAADIGKVIQVAGCVLFAASVLLVSPFASCQEFYSDGSVIVVEREGQVVDRLSVERIRLDYPELDARAEVNAALDSHGYIWAAIGYSVGSQHRGARGFERLFCSRDGGRTWTSQILPMTEDCHFIAFTVLDDDAFLLVTAVNNEDPAWRKLVRVWRSDDAGQTWRQTCEIAADPFENVGEGFLSLTQLRDGSILLPMCRWTDRGEERELVHSLFVSTDGGRSFPTTCTTYPDSVEAHVIELLSGRLLGAFRHQRPARPGETPEEIRALGGDPEWKNPATGKQANSVFKHVWIGASADGGRTWGEVGAVRDGQGRALLVFGECHGQLVQVPDGRVVLVHDCRYPYDRSEMRARVSNDEGRTWEPETYHVSGGMGYPSSVALPDGTIVTITGCTRLDARFRPIDGWQAEAIRWRLPARGP